MPISSSFFTSALHTGAALLLLKYGDPVDPKQVKIETGPSNRDISINVELTRDRNDLIATGCVQPKFGCWDPPMWRKVKIQILSPRGTVTAKSDARWSIVPCDTPRTCASMKRWPFQVRFHGIPEKGSTVRVTSDES